MKIEINTNELEKLMPLHPNEIRLLTKIREDYKYGEITIKIQDGIPLRIEKGMISENLSQKDEAETDV